MVWLLNVIFKSELTQGLLTFGRGRSLPIVQNCSKSETGCCANCCCIIIFLLSSLAFFSFFFFFFFSSFFRRLPSSSFFPFPCGLFFGHLICALAVAMAIEIAVVAGGRRRSRVAVLSFALEALCSTVCSHVTVQPG